MSASFRSFNFVNLSFNSRRACSSMTCGGMFVLMRGREIAAEPCCAARYRLLEVNLFTLLFFPSLYGPTLSRNAKPSGSSIMPACLAIPIKLDSARDVQLAKDILSLLTCATSNMSRMDIQSFGEMRTVVTIPAFIVAMLFTLPVCNSECCCAALCISSSSVRAHYNRARECYKC